MKLYGPVGDKAVSQVVYASAARTESPDPVELEDWAGCSLVVISTAHAATPSVVASIEGYDPASDSWVELLAAAAITGETTKVLTVSPTCDTAANVSLYRRLPQRFRVVLTHADSDSITYSASVWLEPDVLWQGRSGVIVRGLPTGWTQDASDPANVSTAGGDLDTAGGDVTLGGGLLDTEDGDIDAGSGDVIVAGAVTGWATLVPGTVPEVPASPTAQDIVDVLVAWGTVTQAAP